MKKVILNFGVVLALFMAFITPEPSEALTCRGLFTPEAAAAPHTARTPARPKETALDKKLSEIIRSELPPGSRTEQVRALLKFAEQHNLPMKWLELGPEDRKIKRLFVAIDVANPKVLKAYRDTFNLEKAVGKDTWTLALEYVRESITNPEHYVPAIMRRYQDPLKPGYRWGKHDPYMESYQKYFDEWFLTTPGRKSPDLEATGIAGFGHLIEVNAKEKANIEYFLENPESR
jgi:hypothetical protein